MPEYLSGRDKRRDQGSLTSDRYQYLDLSQAEPNLGDPKLGDVAPTGTRYQLVSLVSNPGERFWIPVGGGIRPAGISIFDEENLVGGQNSTTQLYFKGSAVTAIGQADDGTGQPGIAATIIVAPPGIDKQVMFNNAGDFAGATNLIYDNSTNRVGIASTIPERLLDIGGDMRLEGTIYDQDGDAGDTGQLLRKTAEGGLKWFDQAQVDIGAGGDIYEVQYHSSAGSLDGAENFVYRSDTERVGIGSTLPKVTLDVLGQADFDLFKVSGIATFDCNVDFVGASTAFWNKANSRFEFEDGAKLAFGNTPNLEIYFDGSNVYFDNISGGANSPIIFGSSSAKVAEFTPSSDGPRVILYHNNSKKFETVTGGVTVTGETTTDDLIISDEIIIEDDARVAFGNDEDFEIKYSTSEGSLIDTKNSKLSIKSGSTEYASFADNSKTKLSYDGNVKFETESDGVSIIGIASVQNIRAVGISTFDKVVINGNVISSLNSHLIFNVGAGKSVYSNSHVIINSQANATAEYGGSLQVKGGAGIASDLYVGENMIIEENLHVLGNLDIDQIINGGSIDIKSDGNVVGSARTINFAENITIGSTAGGNGQDGYFDQDANVYISKEELRQRSFPLYSSQSDTSNLSYGIVGTPNYSQTQFFSGSLTNSNDKFGHSTALSGDGKTLVVGSPYVEDPYHGIAYVFKTMDRGTKPHQVGILTHNEDFSSSTDGLLGYSVATNFDGSIVVVGAPKATPTGTWSMTDPGAVLVFRRSNFGQYERIGILTGHSYSGSGYDYAHFGHSVAITDDGRTIAVGQVQHTSSQNPSTTGISSVYIFDKNFKGTYDQVGVLGTGDDSWLGYSLDFSGNGNQLVVGMPNDGSTSNGNFKVYDRTAFGNPYHAAVTDPYAEVTIDNNYGLSLPGPNNSQVGKSVAISYDGNFVLVGCPGLYDSATGLSTSYLYKRQLVPSPNWSDNNANKIHYRVAGILTASFSSSSHEYGSTVSINADGSVMAIGAPGHQYNGSNGSVFIFVNNGRILTGPTGSQTIMGQVGIVTGINSIDSGDTFGNIVKLSPDGNRLYVGDSSEDGSGTDLGYMYIFEDDKNVLLYSDHSKIIIGDVSGPENLSSNISMAVSGNIQAGNSSNHGIILKSPNGTKYKLKVSDTGEITSIQA